MRYAHWAAVIFRTAALTFLGFAVSLALQLALAEAVFREDTAGAVERAISIQSGPWSLARAGNSSYYERLAALDPEHARGVFARAVEVNPRSSPAWMGLGLAAERGGDFAEAERALLGAAAADHQYVPAWTLANFYFRRIFFQQGDPHVFWAWARRAAAFGNEDLQPLLTLCDRLDPDRFPERLGESPVQERAYLDFFIGQNRLGGAQLLALKMARRRTPGAASRLLDFTERQLRAGNGNAALEIWNALAVAQSIPFPPAGPLDSTKGDLTNGALTNGDLKIAPTGQGFDWRLPQSQGVAVEWRNSRLAFSFSGSQSEACRLVEQFLLLKARRYRLRFEYSAAGMPAPTGVRWTIDSIGDSTGDSVGEPAGYSNVSRAEGAAEPSPIPQNEAWSSAEWIFSRTHSSLARLALIYQREPGTTRAEGRFEIRNLRLEAL